ncbi:MAG: cyclopropane-fatty-acyl-phospholipid synthase family protein [Pseudomonadota bacterium]
MFLKLLEQHIRTGTLHLHLPGRDYTFGREGPEAHWYIQDESAIGRIARDWEYEMGETYMQGAWNAGTTGLHALLEVLRSNFAVQQPARWMRALGGAVQQWNRVANSYRNVAAHYDVPEPVFRRFLDQEMFYSCAYFAEPTYSIDEAQQAKARHIAGKLLVRPGDHILDIGCGWGSMAFHLASNYDCKVTGITLSREQLAVALREKEKRGLHNVNFELCDYREHKGSYDRVVSIGMFEHVGRPYHATYFRKVNELLKPDGAALIHTIGRTGSPGLTNRWIHRYIFPGGSTPSLSELAPAIEASKLRTTDVEVWRLHYAETLHHWYERFQQHRGDIADLMQEEFCRMWEFYLASCEAAFRASDLVVYQMQLAKRHGVVPITRDYLYR